MTISVAGNTVLPNYVTQVQGGGLLNEVAATVTITLTDDGCVPSPATVPAGPVTYGRLFEVQPFGNELFKITVRGRDLRQYLERRVRGRAQDAEMSGATVTYDPSRPAGSRISEVRLTDGSWLSDDRQYTVAMNDFMVTNASFGFGTAAVLSENLRIVDLEALITYLHSLPQPIGPPAGPRFVARP